MIPFLPLRNLTRSFEPALSEALRRVTESGWYLQGGECRSFEEKFASYTGTAYCIGVASGLDALTLSLMAMKAEYSWPDEAEVIVPDLTFVATAQAVVRAGLVPVLADVSDDALLTVETASQVLTPLTCAIIPVHLYGRMAPIEELLPWAHSCGLRVLEDAAQAHGSVLLGRRAGSWGDMAAFSFYPGKNLGALGDGGAVTTNDEALAHRVRILANYGAEKKYHHTVMGMNSRLDELQAAVLDVKLPRLDADNDRRRQIASLYASHISHPLMHLPYAGDTLESVFHIYPLRCSCRDRLMHHLQERGIQTLIHYPFTLSHQPALQPYARVLKATETRSQRWADTEISLPIHPLMTDDEVLLVCQALNEF